METIPPQRLKFMRPARHFVDEGEAGGHLVRNEGNVNLVVIAVRLFPEGVAPRIDLPNPGYNPSLN